MLNVPTYTTTNFSFGPGRVFMGAAGTTPSVDVGGLTEDGIKLTVTSKKKDIFQGNPKLVCYTFAQEQGCMVEFSGIEWNQNLFEYGLGAGTTTSVASADNLSFGGDPIVEQVAIWIQHQMAVPGHTLNAYIWQAVSDGDLALNLGQDEHKFPYKYKAQRVTTDWSGATLATDAQLVKLYRQKT